MSDVSPKCFAGLGLLNLSNRSDCSGEKDAVSAMSFACCGDNRIYIGMTLRTGFPTRKLQTVLVNFGRLRSRIGSMLKKVRSHL